MHYFELANVGSTELFFNSLMEEDVWGENIAYIIGALNINYSSSDFILCLTQS